MGGVGGLEACGPRAAASHGRAGWLMMDCDGGAGAAASDPWLPVMGLRVTICVWGRQPVVQRRVERHLAIGANGSGSASSSASAEAAAASRLQAS